MARMCGTGTPSVGSVFRNASGAVDGRGSHSAARRRQTLGLNRDAMSIRWEHLAGDTGEFALKLAFARDPDDGQATEPDVGLSWGSFQLWIEGRNLCVHQEQGERSESVHWHLLPLMEWFVRHWNPLLHEERLPARNDGDTAWESLRATRFPPGAIEDDEQQSSRWESAWQKWWERHALRAASAGGLFPDVILRRVRDLVEISWGPARVAGMPEGFDFAESERGFRRLPPQAVADPLHEVLSGASGYLLSLNPESERLKALSTRVAALRVADRHRDRRLMWLAGLGTDERTVHAGWQRAKRYLSECAEGPRLAMLKAWESPLTVTGSCQAALMFGSLAPTARKSDVLQIARTMIDLYDAAAEPQPIDGIRRPVRCEELGDPAWYQAYELADELHDSLRLRFDDDVVDVDDALERLGVTVADRELSDEAIRGIAISGAQHRPGILVNVRHSANEHLFGRRFTLAHELCHLLFDAEVGTHLAVASGPWAPRDIERRANAFAAMFLMPNRLVRRALSTLAGPLKTRNDVLAVANRLCTSFASTLWHLNNLGYVDSVTRQRIEQDGGRPRTH